MTTIRASCTSCGDVQLTCDKLSVRVCTTTDEGSYSFECPRCGTAIRKPAEHRIIDILLASGVELIEWSLPAELLETHEGLPISHDDLIEWHDLLQNEDAFAVALGMLTAEQDKR